MNDWMPSGRVIWAETRCSASASLHTKGRRAASAPPTTPSPTLKTMRLTVSSAKPRVATGAASPRRSTARTALLSQLGARSWTWSSRWSWMSEGVRADAIM